MTSWHPGPVTQTAPLYLSIVDALARDIENGTLPAGARLPTHRELARLLDVNVGTVTRAYREAAVRGLTDGEVGRGTYVRHRGLERVSRLLPRETEPALIDLAFNVPVGTVPVETVREALADVARDPELLELFAHYHLDGLARHREVGAGWLRRKGLEATGDRTLVTTGAQQAMALALPAVTRAGDVVLAESLTYPGIKAVTRQLHLRTTGVAMDDEGLIPEAFERACRAGARVLYTMPNVHNPTGIVLSTERRRAVAEIARAHDVAIVEDDTYGFLLEEPPPPIASFAPERTWFVTSFSKSLAAGLRCGLILVPEETAGCCANLERLRASTGGVGWLAAPLMAELATRWIADGTIDRIVRAKIEESTDRQQIARRVLGCESSVSTPTSCHLWISLPDPWRSEDFVARARVLGVAVSPPGSFVVGRAPAPHAVRLCIGTPRTRAELEQGLGVLARLLRGRPHEALSVV